jgi:hypothetical protein
VAHERQIFDCLGVERLAERRIIGRNRGEDAEIVTEVDVDPTASLKSVRWA